MGIPYCGCSEKKNGCFRICSDYKVTHHNQNLAIDQYPLSGAEELFATLAGGKIFTKLDLAQAYLQVLLEEQSKYCCAIDTHQGLYKFNRLPFGISPAPAMFQKLMDTVLQGIPGVINRLKIHGFRLKKEKCKFILPSVEYLGHQINHEGIRPLEDKVEAIAKAPTPSNLRELKSFLRLLNYYGKFIPNLATIIHPLTTLLSTGHSS